MPLLNDVGEIYSFSMSGVYWIIRKFYELPQKPGTLLESSTFRFADSTWKMGIYPNGSNFLFLGWFAIYVVNENPGERYVIRLGIAGEQGNIMSPRIPFGSYKINGCYQLIPGSYLEFQKDNLVPRENLHLFFIIETGNDVLDKRILEHVKAEDGDTSEESSEETYGKLLEKTYKKSSEGIYEESPVGKSKGSFLKNIKEKSKVFFWKFLMEWVSPESSSEESSSEEV